MGLRKVLSSDQPRKNRTLKRGESSVRKKEKQSRSPLRRVIVGSVLACVMVITVIGGRSVVRWVNEQTHIQQFTVLGLERLSRQEILKELNLPSDSSLWSIKPEQMSEQLTAHPWIRSVTFDRVFPHSLVIQVQERRPAAILGSSKNDYFLDVEGYLLPGEITESNETLPVVEGLTPKTFVQQQDESHRRAREGIHLASLLSERFTGRPRINVAREHTTVVDLPRLRVQFGQEAERQWQRFLVLYPTLKEQVKRQVQEVDLRFSQKVILRKRML